MKMSVLIVCMILGCVATHYIGKVVTAENTLLVLVGILCAGIGFSLVVSTELPHWAKYTVAIATGIGGGFLLKGHEHQVLSYGTAFTGSKMIAEGTCIYLGSSAMSFNQFDGVLVGCVIAIAALTYVGGKFQLKKQSEKEASA